MSHDESQSVNLESNASSQADHASAAPSPKFENRQGRDRLWTWWGTNKIDDGRYDGFKPFDCEWCRVYTFAPLNEEMK